MPRHPALRVGAAGKPERKGSEVRFRKLFATRFFPTGLLRIPEMRSRKRRKSAGPAGASAAASPANGAR